MWRLNDPNPYEVLDLDPSVKKEDILQAFNRKGQAKNQDHAQIRKAFDILRRSDDRLLVDALTFTAQKDEFNRQQLLEEFPELEEEKSLTDHPAVKDILQKSLDSHIQFAFQLLYTDVQKPEVILNPLEDFDQFDNFLDRCVK